MHKTSTLDMFADITTDTINAAQLDQSASVQVLSRLRQYARAYVGVSLGPSGVMGYVCN